MHEKCSRIGISGGTFDPIHYGHLIITEEARERFSLDKVLFIPSGKPPHKVDTKVTEQEHRLNMVSLAVGTNPHFEVSNIEMERKGYIYTVDTLMQLRRVYGDKAKLFFIIGADIVWDLLKWKDPRRLFGLCEFIVAFRPGYDGNDFIGEIEKLRTEYNTKIHIAETPLMEISSTDIRERIRNKRSVKYLVPESVERYIYDNNLYVNEATF